MQENRIELAGYLAAKPEVRYLPSGTPVANARLAEGYRYKDRNEQVGAHELAQHRLLRRVVRYRDRSSSGGSISPSCGGRIRLCTSRGTRT